MLWFRVHLQWREWNCECFPSSLAGSPSCGHNDFRSSAAQYNPDSKTSLITLDSPKAALTGIHLGRCFSPYLLHPSQCPAFPAAQHGTVGLLQLNGREFRTLLCWIRFCGCCMVAWLWSTRCEISPCPCWWWIWQFKVTAMLQSFTQAITVLNFLVPS